MSFDVKTVSPQGNMTNENINAIGIRYIPKVGAPGADLIHTILYPQELVPYKVYNCEGSLNWINIPNSRGLVHTNIVNQLSNLPLISMFDPILIKAKVIMKTPLCRIIY